MTSALAQQLSLIGANPPAGPGNEFEDAASVRADHPVPADSGLYYFEVTVVNKGRDGFIGQLTLLPLPRMSSWVCSRLQDSLAGVGFSTADVKLERLPGWELHSYGYHGNDGMAFKSCATGNQYGPKWTAGGQVL